MDLEELAAEQLPAEVVAALQPAVALVHQQVREQLLLSKFGDELLRKMTATARAYGESKYYRLQDNVVNTIWGPDLLAQCKQYSVSGGRSSDYHPDEDEDDEDDENSCYYENVRSCCGCCSECDCRHYDYADGHSTREITVGRYTAQYCTECDHQCQDETTDRSVREDND